MPHESSKPKQLGSKVLAAFFLPPVVPAAVPAAVLLTLKFSMPRFGAYGGGVVEFKVPFQQYVLKQAVQTAGTFVFVLSKLRERIAQPTQVGHCGSTVPLPIVAER